MDENTEGSEQLTDEQIHENLRAHAEALDAGEEPAAPVVSKTPASTDKPGEVGSEAEEGRASEAETGKKPSSETSPEGEGKEAEGAEGAEAKPGEQKPAESRWKKAKEKTRLDRSWKALEAEKQAVRQREQQLAEIANRRQTQPEDISRAPRFKSNEYWNEAQSFEQKGLKLMKDGDTEAAEEQFRYAQLARDTAQKAYEAEYQEAQSKAYQQFTNTWTATAEAVIKDNPALADPESQMSVDMLELLEQYPMLGQYPEGFKYGYEILKLRMTAGEVSELREENKKLKKENERLNGLTSISGSHDATRQSSGGGTDFYSMTEEQQREHLRRDAEAQDAA